jgi:hypothetical protein
MIHDNGSHSDKNIVLQGAAVDDRIMADAAVVPDFSGRFLIGAMDDGTILNIHPVADPDGVHVPADHRIEPKTAIVSGNDISYNRRIIGDKTVFAESGMFSVDGKQQWHRRRLDIFSKFNP